MIDKKTLLANKTPRYALGYEYTGIPAHLLNVNPAIIDIIITTALVEIIDTLITFLCI